MTLAFSLIPALPIAVTMLMIIVTGVLCWLNIRLNGTRQTLHLESETEELENNRLKFQSMFDHSLLAMAFYSPKGLLVDINQNMRDLCGYDKYGEKFFDMRFLDMPNIKGDFDPNGDIFHTCQRMLHPKADLEKDIELKIKSIKDENGQVLFYVTSAIDCSEDRNTYLTQLRQDAERRKTSKAIKKYEEELYYLLSNNKMFVWSIDYTTQTVNISTKLSTMDFTISFDEYVAVLESEESRNQARLLAENYENFDQNILITRQFNKAPVNNQPGWYSISGMPLYDKNHRVMGHFGVAREITHLIKVQEQLQRETNRAQASIQQKSAFLANMSHEIRTPLNAIIGFSDLLQAIEDTTDRHEFIRIILNNCDMLLRIINDILEVSNIDQANLTITPKEVDFAQAFNDICETLAQRVQEPGVQFIADNPYSSFRTVLDKGRMQQVITNFLTNAVKYTHHGHIKVGYRYQKDPKTETTEGIYMYCEDTGAGIPKEKQGSVFERFVKLNDFVQGTGLGLSICESIAKQCNGQIGLFSEGDGHGSTFWIWVPCQRLDGTTEMT